MSELAQKINAWLAGVSNRTGVALSLDTDGVCGIDCGEGLEAGVLVLEPDQVGLFAEVARTQDENRDRLSAVLLQRNLFAVRPQGAAYGLDDETGIAYLCLSLPAADLDPERFQDKLGEFILAARAAQQELSALEPERTDESLEADISPPQPMFWAFNRA